MATAFALLPLAWFINEKQKIQLLCEKQVLQSQENLVKGENLLLELNIPARALVLQKKSLEAAILAAPTPVEKAALTAQLLVVIGQMRTLRTKQLWTIKIYEARAQGSLMVLQTEVRKEISRVQKLLDALPIFVFFNQSTPRIKLLTVFIDPLLPIYETPPALSVIQSLRAQIEMRGRRFFPHWLEFLRAKSFQWRESCTSHPRKGGFQWEAYLGMGKSF
jgi:hypothetical protein